MGGIDDTNCGDATSLLSASRAKQRSDEAIILKLQNELNPATVELDGIDYTHCGDATLSQSASQAEKTSDEAFTMKLQKN